MKSIALLSLLLAACTFTTQVYIVDDAGSTDASTDYSAVFPDVSIPLIDAGADNYSPNTWIYQQPNLSLKYDNCNKIIGDASTTYIEMEYLYDAGTYKSAIPFYYCSNAITDNCDVEHLIINHNQYYSTPAPTIAGGVPNTLGSNCTLKTYTEANYASGSGEVFDWYIAGYSPIKDMTDCTADGGTLYTTMLLFYDDNFQVMVDKNSSANMVFTCF